VVSDRDDPQVYPPAELQARLLVSENWYRNTEDQVDKLWLELRGG